MKYDLPKVLSLVSKTAREVCLIQGKEYPVIEISEEDYRVVDEEGEPILYPKSYFHPLEIPPIEGWLFHYYEGGDYNYYPPEFAGRCLFERFFDRDPDAIRVFREFCTANGIDLPAA